ncbi:MAG: terminase [Gammaproteobacteria bacterium]|nr:terminase [Rhodocyclaceae bacterium]MBU3907594.1 terminase [Gammaproteobacteria bacterium]MBU3989668.1 terminase [Gammaproteobacteria bacterium]MBU4004240.1 terminase [Gammaproteobacteria bacterium]MBU4019649.1 terminase [Gammaproteobacteria bacterium]
MANANITVKRYNVFLAELAIDGNVTRAANATGVDRSNAYQRRLRNPDFAKRWDDAIEAATDAIEAEAHRRAVDGVEEPIFYKGVECGRVTRYSDPLLIALLKRHRPEYRDSGRVEIANAPGEVLRVEESPIAAARKIAFALQLGLRAAQQSGQDLA